MNYMILFTILYTLIFVLAYYSSLKVQTALSGSGKPIRLGKYLPYGIGLFAIFAVQLFVAQIIPGHVQDSGLFRAWTSFGNEHRLSDYYKTELYVDYPPVYLYILFTIGKIAKLFGVTPASGVYLSFIKFVPILCDGITSVLIFVIAKDFVGESKATTLAFISAINPANWLNSTIWGQVDSFATLLIIGILYALYQKKYVMASALFSLSFLTKPQMVIYAPLMGFTIFFDLWHCFDDKQARKKMLIQIGYCVAVFMGILLIVPLPITGGDYGLLIDNYLHAMGKYPYATLNAANLYGAFGGNWAKDSDTFIILSYKTWGFIFITAMSMLVGYTCYFVKERKKIFYLGAFITATIYMLAHTMHERYLHYLLLMLLILYIFTQDRRMIFGYFAFSITTFLNCGQVLMLNLQNQHVMNDNVLFILLSWVQIVIYCYLTYSGYKMLFYGERLPTVQGKKIAVKRGKAASFYQQKTPNVIRQYTQELSFQKAVRKVYFQRIDIILMVALTLVYSLFAFYRLGSKTVPETGWYPQSAEDSIVLDLGGEAEVKDVYSYAGWIDRRRSDSEVIRDLTMEISVDGEDWETLALPLTLDNIFRWKATTINKSLRYIRLTPDDHRFYLNELAFFGESKNQRFYPKEVFSEKDNQTAHLIMDEQEKVVYEFSWYDGTYFDEIYHPRTAYEHLTHRYPYENTHPPLGKVMIAFGMHLFGVNPFGWRFFGTLCGVLMVPLSYMLGKKMFKSTFYAFCTGLLFTFDFMHLSQTRLATIDSFTTFFIMGMYYFMYKYVKRSFYNEGLKSTLIPLFWSGLCFGLGAATKWQGIYAGFGLAILFGLSLIRRTIEYNLAKKTVKKTPKMEKIVARYPRLLTQTLMAGFLFFVIIPGIVYFLSYIPAMNTTETGLKFFFTNQSSMYNYHASLEASHSYGSSWWSWPLNLRPLYAYSPNRSFVPQGISMGISSFGNPFVWWLSIPVILGALWRVVKGKGNYELATILCGFAAMYLPWVLVSRVAFIYHYFPNVIFVVLGITYFIKTFLEEGKLKKTSVYLYLTAVLVLFVMFYPVLTGMKVPTHYVDQFLKWLPTWVLG